MGFRITFVDNNVAEEGHHVYRSATSMAGLSLAQMPPPVATLGPNVTEWEDGTVTQGETYYYRVGAFTANGTVELLSDEFVALADENTFLPPERNTVSIALVVNDAGHGATTNTKQALLDAGFLDGNITVHLDTTAPPPADIIVVCRAVDTQADWDLIAPAWAAGTPVVLGSTHGGQEGTGTPMPSTFANLTAGWTIEDSVAPATDENVVVDNSHYITQPFALDRLAILTGLNWGYAVDADTAYAGTLLATGDPDPATLAGKATLIAVPAGTSDLQGTPTPAKAVVWGDLYGGQSAYTADGAELLGRCIDWCLG